MKKHKLLILGTRGIPGSSGGLETFAERLATYLTERGWRVTVYCQSDEEKFSYSVWEGINLVHVPVPKNNSFWSVLFDFKAAIHAVQQEGLILTLGYNTGIFSLLYSLRHRANITDIRGMEWCRSKWNALEKSWLNINEKFAVLFSNYLIVDHPQIEYYLHTEVKTDKPIAVISHSTNEINEADEALLKGYNLMPKCYALAIIEPESENSVLEIVSAFSRRKRNISLVIVGKCLSEESNYHKQIVESASDEVMFVGEICDKEVFQSLRYHTCLYFHGHQVGETNSSLIEAMSAGNPILAHKNQFNSWVVGDSAVYFKDESDCDRNLTQLLADRQQLEKMSKNSLERYYAEFADDKDLEAYENLLLNLVDGKNPLLAKENNPVRTKSVV